MRETALILRHEIMDTGVNRLSQELTVEYIYKGKADAPDLLKAFITYVIARPDIKRGNTASKSWRMEETEGKDGRNLGEHLQVGMVMKRLTGSKKIIEILNGLGHCVSYNVVEEIKTEFTYAANEKDMLTPSGMKLDANKIIFALIHLIQSTIVIVLLRP